MKRILLYIVLMLIGLCACEEQINWDTQPEKIDYIVVDGLLTNEKKRHEVSITYPIEEMNMIPEPVTGAEVTISNGQNSVGLQEDASDKGVYKTDSVYGVIGKTYTLSIDHNNKTYTAQTYMIPVTPFDVVDYVAVPDTDNLYRIVPEFSSDEPAMWKLSLDWSHVSGYENTPDTLCRAEMYYYNLQTLDVSQVFSPKKEKVYFPRGTKIIQRKYSLTDEHANFFRTMLSETEWRGGYFDVAPGNVITNLSKGARGYFGASSLLVDSLTVY